MVRSMTGFASGTIILTIGEHGKATLSISIKSLNSRFFETTCKLSYPIANLETECIKRFKAKLLRGHIYFTAHINNVNAFKGAIEPSLPIIRGYLDALDQIKKTFDLEGSLSIAHLLQLPNVFVSEEQELDAINKKLFFETIDNLIEQLITTQQVEGAALLVDIKQRIALMQKEIDIIERAYQILMETQKQKVNQSLIELEMDESKFAEVHKNALYAVLDKIDIHEEIVRFKNHIATLATELESDKSEKGKRLDFILQELGREINTITAKCSDSTISSHAINIKVELEKAREQTQNIV